MKSVLEFRPTVCAGALLAGLAITGVTLPAQAEEERPNIVILFVDDLGWSEIECPGPWETPHLDLLESESLAFTDAYVASPTCSPSRAALVTGRHPARLRLVRHIPGHGTEFSQHPKDPAKMPSRNWLPLDQPTFAAALKKHGYRSVFIGKWHLGHEPYHPVHHGFDQQRGVTNQGHPRSYHPPYFADQETTYRETPPGKHLTERITDDAVDYLRTSETDAPFLLTIFYYAIHAPFQGPADLVKKYEEKGLAGKRAHYAAMIEAVDRSIGRIREALREKGIADDTAVFLLGDQGQNLVPDSPFRGGKRVGTAVYEGSARVPFFVHWPGRVEEGTRCSIPVTSLDLFPTLVEMAGGDVADHQPLDGLSLLPFQEQGGRVAERKAVYLYRSYDGQYAAMRSGRWKMVAYRDGRRELYDLESDLGEENDLAATRPEQVEQLDADLAAWEKRMGVDEFNR